MTQRRKSKEAPAPPPLDPAVQAELLGLVKDGFSHRAEIESRGADAQPPAIDPQPQAPGPAPEPQPAPPASYAPLLPLIKPTPRPKERTGKRNDPDYKPYSTYLLKCLDQRLKIVAARLDVDAADLVNQAVFEFLEGFEEGFREGDAG